MIVQVYRDTDPHLSRCLGLFEVRDGRYDIELMEYEPMPLMAYDPCPVVYKPEVKTVRIRIQRALKHVGGVGWWSDFLQEMCWIIPPERVWVFYAVGVNARQFNALRTMLTNRIVHAATPAP